jgi:hypothetical protein
MTVHCEEMDETGLCTTEMPFYIQDFVDAIKARQERSEMGTVQMEVVVEENEPDPSGHGPWIKIRADDDTHTVSEWCKTNDRAILSIIVEVGLIRALGGRRYRVHSLNTTIRRH